MNPSQMANPNHRHHLLFILVLLSLSPNSPVLAFQKLDTVASPNPFTAKAALLRYWSRKIPSGNRRPDFLVSKLSPLSALDSATYSSLAADGSAAISSRLPAFCAAAGLLCTPAAPLLGSVESHHSDSNFATYQNINFTNYGTAKGGGRDSFTKYSDGLEAISDNQFRRYSRVSVDHDDSFLRYSDGGNVVSDNFTSYGTGSIGGTGDFTTYEKDTNIPNLDFISYETDSNRRKQSFTSYSDDTNVGSQTFTSYGKRGKDIPETFTSYASDQTSNLINSTFTGYGEAAKGAVDSFATYSINGGSPQNKFESYGKEGKVSSDTFSTYHNIFGNDSFSSYGKGGNTATVGFTTYGDVDNGGGDHFKSYGVGSSSPNVSFKTYNNAGTEFKAYAKTGVGFKTYKNPSVVPHSTAADMSESAPKRHPYVEPGKFFRESKLRTGTVMPMPDIRDKMLPRSFLPRSIAGRISFADAEVRRVFGIQADTTMGKAVADTVVECERAPSRGETKRCATSAEDMIDFAAEVLGSGAVARSTERASGSKGDILIGEVTGVDGGKLTHSVSCHQSLFPYLVYYCHSVPKVRVYEAEILSAESKQKINRGVAICHIDTSDWSAKHGAFVALGSEPGKIEVCHWIFKGDLTWTVQN